MTVRPRYSDDLSNRIEFFLKTCDGLLLTGGGDVNPKRYGAKLSAAERKTLFGVDDVRDIQDVPIDQFAVAGETEIPVAGAVTSVIEIDGRRMLVLDVKTVVQQVIGQGR